MKFLAAAGLAGACLATSPVIAADLFDSGPPPLDAPAPEAELGSNWYIRGDIGYGVINQDAVVPAAGLIPPQINGGFFNNAGNYTQLYNTKTQPLTFNDAPIGDPANPVPVTRGNAQTASTATFDIGVGYRINDFLRVEATYSFFRGPGYSASGTVTCPEVANAVSQTNVSTVGGTTTTTTTPVGYQWDATTCDGRMNITQYNNLGLATAYVDLGHWWGGLSPYIGAGLGLNVNSLSGSLTYTTTSNGQTYSGPTVNGTAPATWVVQTGTDSLGNPQYAPLQASNGHAPAIPIGTQNWNRTISQTKYTIAGQLAAGIGMPISQSATLDLGYKVTTTDITGGVKGLLQSVNLGVRYNLN
jgi:hypothetical protein